MYENRLGIPVYHDTEKMIEDLNRENSDSSMEYTYNDENRGTSQICYDGSLIDAEEAMIRYDRDRARGEMYTRAEQQLDIEQMTWDDVVEDLHPKGKNHVER